jgi:hypothetical protein
VLAKQPRALMCNFPLSPTIGRNQKGKTLSKSWYARTINSINQKTHQQHQDISSTDLVALRHQSRKQIS